MSRSAMAELADRGEIQIGTMIELVPEVLPANADPGVFRARVVKPPGGRDSLLWNNEVYSPASLLYHFERNHGVWGRGGVHRNWRILGHAQSFRDEVNCYAAM